MKRRFDLRKWVFNYIFYGYFISLIFINIFHYIFYKEFDICFETLRGNFIIAILIMFFSLEVKKLYYEYKELWKESGVVKRVFIILGLIFIIYGVYSRARISGTFN